MASQVSCCNDVRALVYSKQLAIAPLWGTMYVGELALLVCVCHILDTLVREDRCGVVLYCVCQLLSASLVAYFLRHALAFQRKSCALMTSRCRIMTNIIMQAWIG